MQFSWIRYAGYVEVSSHNWFELEMSIAARCRFDNLKNSSAIHEVRFIATFVKNLVIERGHRLLIILS